MMTSTARPNRLAGILAALFLLLIGLVGCSDDDSPTGPEALTGNSLRITAVTPPVEGPLLFGEPLEITVDYSTDLDDGAEIYTTLISNGVPSPHQALQVVTGVDRGSGTVSRTATIEGTGTRITAVRAYLTDKNRVMLDSVEVSFVTDYTGAFVGNVSISPASPGVVGIDERVEVAFDCGSALPAGHYVWARAYNGARYAPGLTYQASGVHTGRARITRTFTLRQTGTVDRVNITMEDADTRDVILQHNVAVAYTFQ